MTHDPDDLTATVAAIADKINAGVSRARAKVTGRPDVLLTFVETAIVLDNEQGVRAALQLLSRWAEGDETTNGMHDVADYRDAAEALKMASDYLRTRDR